jgi:hypothetical protein
MNQTNIDNCYSTRDLVLATYLKLRGIKLSNNYDIETKTWSFEDSEMCTKISLELRNGNSNVDIFEYESTRRSLLGMVYDKKRT